MASPLLGIHDGEPHLRERRPVAKYSKDLIIDV